MTSGGKTTRRKYLKAAGVGATALLAGCTGDDGGGTGDGEDTTDGGTTTGDSGGSTPEEILIGGNHPLSGSLSRAGQAMANSGKLAVKHVNEGGVIPGFENGGIPALNGAKLKWKAKDNKGDPQLGAEVEQQLIEAGAKVITGCYSSPVTLSATQIAERKGCPHIVDVSVADEILQGRQTNWTYRAAPSAQRFSKNYAEFMPEIARANNKPMETASLVYLNTAFGQSMRDHLKDFLPRHDVKLILEEAYSFGQASMNTAATKVKQADADAFIFVGYGTGGIRMMNAFQNINYRPPLLTGSATPTFTSPNIVKEIGKFINGGFGNNYDYNYDLDWTDVIYADYRKLIGEPLNVIHTVMTYTVVVVAANAIQKAGSATRADINKAIKDIKVSKHPASMGPIIFKKNGENKNALAPMLQVQDLKPVIVWPKKYQQAQPKFPKM